jgi:DNA polymerase-3 subunit delta'
MQNPIIGHQQIVEQLQRTVASDRIAGAYLFVGPVGVGKETVAHHFARLIFCQQDTQPPTVCGACLACRKVDSGNHPDLQRIRPEGSLLRIGQIRELQRRIIYEPLEASRKVYILTDVERMNAEAENCLLKTLEEPPASSVLILLTSNIQALLPTTRSRCQVLQFHPMPTRELAKILTDRFSVAPEQAAALAIAAGGAIGKALTQLEKSSTFTEEVPEILRETDLLAAFRLAESLKDKPETLEQLEKPSPNLKRVAHLLKKSQKSSGKRIY